MTHLLLRYQSFLAEADAWFARCQELRPQEIRCARGCRGCCRGLFDISLLDAALLRDGCARLAPEVVAGVHERAGRQLAALQAQWPDFAPPYLLNLMPEAVWTAMPEDDPTPCPLLGADGLCLVYDWRPLTCRTHGLPQIDLSGEIFDSDYCTLNFGATDPLADPALRWGFRAFFEREFALLGSYAETIFGRHRLELDTFIPCAVLFDGEAFDWRTWGEGHLFR